MREPRRDLFGNDLPSRWEDRFVDFMHTLPTWMQPWFALGFLLLVGGAFFAVLYLIVT